MLQFPQGIQSSFVRDTSQQGRYRIGWAARPTDYRMLVRPFGGEVGSWDTENLSPGSSYYYAGNDGDAAQFPVAPPFPGPGPYNPPPLLPQPPPRVGVDGVAGAPGPEGPAGAAGQDGVAAPHALGSGFHTDVANSLAAAQVSQDLLLYNGTLWNRLAKGTSDDQVLAMVGGNVAWAELDTAGSDALSVSAEEWVDINANGTAVIGTGDWRGRVIWYGILFYNGTPTAVNTAEWSTTLSGAPSPFLGIDGCGDSYGSDLVLCGDSWGGGTYSLFVDSGSGNLKLTITSWTTRAQFRVMALASATRSANTKTIGTPP